MEPDSRFLSWLCGDLLDERSRLACAQWLLLQSLGLPAAADPPPQLPGPQRIAFQGFSLGLSVASELEERPSFPMADLAVDVWLFALLQGQERAVIQPLLPEHWLFWMVPVGQLHAGRRSIGVRPLMRAQGEGLPLMVLAERLNTLIKP